MKKFLIGAAAMTLVISISSINAFASGGGCGRNFAGNDNDGVCDYYNTSCQFIDNDGDGICDNYKHNGCGNGKRYVDADGDGICDNYKHNGCGNGRGYVDANGDGICDNYGANGCINSDVNCDGICGNYGAEGCVNIDADRDGGCDIILSAHHKMVQALGRSLVMNMAYAADKK